MRKLCEYCGDHATTVDHVIPRSWLGVARGKSTGDTEQVPCCHDCNVHLSNFYLHTIEERTDYIKKYLKREWNNLEVEWPYEEDWKQLGNNLRRIKITRTLELARLEARLAWPKDPDWMRDREKVRWIVAWSNFKYARKTWSKCADLSVT